MAKSDSSDNGQNQRIEWLAEQIAYHSDLYYNQAMTEISDSEFDAFWDELKQLEPTHSQLQRVGAEIDPGTPTAAPPSVLISGITSPFSSRYISLNAFPGAISLKSKDPLDPSL